MDVIISITNMLFSCLIISFFVINFIMIILIFLGLFEGFRKNHIVPIKCTSSLIIMAHLHVPGVFSKGFEVITMGGNKTKELVNPIMAHLVVPRGFSKVLKHHRMS